MDCIVHGVAKSQTQWSDFHFHFLSLSFKDSGFAIGFPWRVASIWACLVSFLICLSFLGLDLPLLFSVTKGIGGYLDHLI